MAITNLDDLRTHLRWAIQVEHSTVPPYLYAYYSIKDPNSPAAQLIRSVVVEEMLHMALASNLINAVGVSPDLADPVYLPTYPGDLPHHNPEPPLLIRLEPCSIALLRDVFMRIEQPEQPPDPPEDDNYQTLGQFYAAIRAGLQLLDQSNPHLFSGDPRKQVNVIYEAGPAGQIVEVFNLASALAAIEEIVDQGEGTDRTEYTSPDDHELAHYWKFWEIVNKVVPFDQEHDVYPVVSDPRTADLPSGDLRELAQLFNDCYCLLLRVLTQIFAQGNSSPLVQHGVIFTLMSYVLTPIAGLLVQTTIPGKDQNAGPSFEYSTTPQAQIIERCKQLASSYPILVGVFDQLMTLPTIDPHLVS
jgi:hypothetical protein